MAGALITLEGGEGAGKSTLLRGLVVALEARGTDIVATREPGGTPLAEAIRALVLTPPDGAARSALVEALLMNAARADHVERLIAPALRAGRTVISDRYADSTRVYQSLGAGVPMAQLIALETMVTRDARPDLTLILDADPGDLLTRRAGRGTASDVFEDRDMAFHRAVRQGFLEIAEAEPDRCEVLDACAEPGLLLDKALALVIRRIGP